MKIFTTFLLFLAAGLIVFNLTLLDFNKPFKGDNMAAIVGVIAPICAVLILIIFKMSKKIEETLKRK